MLIKPSQLVKLSLKFYLDRQFILNGNYQNVTRGLQAFDQTDISELKLVDDLNDLAELGFRSSADIGKVWQSPFQNWVYESGVSHTPTRGETQKTAPILCSGAYVNGVFKPTQAFMPWGAAPGWDPTLVPTIDWNKGRVVFSSGLAATDTVQADYSYKEYLVGFADRNNVDPVEYVTNTQYGTNPATFYSIVYPSGRFRPLPAVFISLDSRFGKPLELGNLAYEEIYDVAFWVYSLDVGSFDDIIDTIRYQEGRPFNTIDYNVSPLPFSGVLGDLSPDYRPYTTLDTNVVTHPSGYTSLYSQGHIRDCRTRVMREFSELEFGMVNCELINEVIIPDGPLTVAPLDLRFFDVGRTS